MSDLKELGEMAKKNAEGLNTLTKNFDGLVNRLSKTPAANQPRPEQVFGAPFARTGENSMSSRGYSFVKMIGLLSGECSPEQAKVEMDVHNRLHAIYVKELGNAGYQPAGNGSWGAARGRFLAPLATSYMHDELVPISFRHEMKSLQQASVSGADPDEANWIRQKALGASGYNYGQKDMSWLNELSGGALVAPPEFGELIGLLRNKEALISAGARTVPLPPQGRMKFPRQTAASNTYWVGENKAITTSDLGTGEVTLQAKKLAVAIRSPNELIRFASPAAEALFRDDITKSLALGLDLAGLEGAGGDTRPLGVINHANINTINSQTQGANGDQLVGGDIYRIIAALEESNVTEGNIGFIMRPKTMYKYYQLRAAAVGQNDSQGPFLFNMIREAGEKTKPTLAGYPVTTSTQVSQVRTKGTSTSLTYVLAGAWDEMLIGMFGAIEFAAATQGVEFLQDQTTVRGILSCDVALRHEAAFVFLDSLDVVNL